MGEASKLVFDSQKVHLSSGEKLLLNHCVLNLSDKDILSIGYLPSFDIK